MKIVKKEAKTLVRKGGPSIFSWSELYLNPYQGCYHNCVYCDGKSEHYHMHDDFGDRIYVKENASALFRRFLKNKGFRQIHNARQSAIDQFFPSLKEIPKAKTEPKTIITIGGGVCDVYQQAEKSVKITLELLEIVYEHQLPLWILTKSDLVLRDIDLIKKINEETYACVNFTITLADEQAQKIFEPRASTTNERFETIKKLRKEGIHSGIYAYPSLPFIGDTDENISEIYSRAKQAGAEFIYCSGLTLKPGRSKNEYMETIRKHYPELYPKYELLYGNNNKYGYLDYEQFKKMNLVWPEIRGFKHGYEHDIGYVAERYVPEGRIKTNLKLSELLRKINYIKKTIVRDPKYEIQAFGNAARLTEESKRDFGEFKEIDFQDIPVAKYVRETISEFIIEKKSTYLEELEKRAYEHIISNY